MASVAPCLCSSRPSASTESISQDPGPLVTLEGVLSVTPGLPEFITSHPPLPCPSLSFCDLFTGHKVGLRVGLSVSTTFQIKTLSQRSCCSSGCHSPGILRPTKVLKRLKKGPSSGPSTTAPHFDHSLPRHPATNAGRLDMCYPPTSLALCSPPGLSHRHLPQLSTLLPNQPFLGLTHCTLCPIPTQTSAPATYNPCPPGLPLGPLSSLWVSPSVKAPTLT